MINLIISCHNFRQQIKGKFSTSISILLVIILSIQINAQKGIFRNGIVYPKTYNENISFDIESQLIFVYVNIEGKKYKFLVDTGAPTTISNNVKGNFQLIVRQDITDASGNVEKVDYVSVPKLSLGNLMYKNFAAMRADIGLFKTLGIDGILGANLICKSVWDFNITNNAITVSDKIYENIKDFRKIKTKILDSGTPTLSMSYFNAEKEEKVYFDTGYNGFFYLSYSVFERLLSKNLVKKYIEGSGFISESAFGSSSGKTYLLPLQMRIGEVNIDPFLAGVDYDEESNLGSVWLLGYRTILSKRNMYFKKYKNVDVQKTLITKGIHIKRNKSGLIVSFVWENSFAQKNGVKPGDKILSINGKNCSIKNTLEIDSIINDFYKNKEAILEINVNGNFVELCDEVLLRARF
ncbi:aspartyl protease family protein [Chryseobacterium sp. Chry.R1]|uniref:aspartyl protease family protein n=1 Tax=Chryseobacterium sp. Chry.R1 TaxID=3139392 RepID=UPI0031F9D158